MVKAYIVSKFGGEWEDSWEHPVCAYADREEAGRHADRLTKEQEEQKEQAKKCSDCDYAFYGLGDKPDCFEPCEDDPESCETLTIIYDDWHGVNIEPIEMKPKRGVWLLNFIDTNGESTHFYSCSVCDGNLYYPSKYCPHCGAKMFGKNAESEEEE